MWRHVWRYCCADAPSCHCCVVVVDPPADGQDWDQQPLQSGGTSRPGHLLLRAVGQSERSNQVSVEPKGFLIISVSLTDSSGFFLLVLFLFSFSHSIRCQSCCQTSRRAHGTFKPIMCSSSEPPRRFCSFRLFSVVAF